MPTTDGDTDPRLDDVQKRVDEIRNRLPDNPGLDVVDEHDVPAYLEDDETDDYLGQAP